MQTHGDLWEAAHWAANASPLLFETAQLAPSRRAIFGPHSFQMIGSADRGTENSVPRQTERWVHFDFLALKGSISLASGTSRSDPRIRSLMTLPTDPLRHERPAEPSTHPNPTPAQRRYARQLYTQYSEPLLSFFRAVGRLATADAGDLVQQTFSELLETLVRRRDLEIRHPRAFLFKLGARQLYAVQRRGTRQPIVDSNAPLGTLRSDDARADLEYCASLRAEQRLVLRAMRTLRGTVGTALTNSGAVSPLQLLVYFRFWLGLTLEEVAEIFEVTPGVISGRQREALDRLRRRVAEITQQQDSSDSTSTTMLVRWRKVLEREAATLPPPVVPP